MKIYSHFGFNDFIICLGYKGYMIKEYFANYFIHSSDLTIDLKNNNIDVHNSNCEPWKVTLIGTGLNTQTSGRIKRVQKYIGNGALIYLLTVKDYHKFAFINESLSFFREHILAKAYFVKNYLKDEKLVKKFNAISLINTLRYGNKNDLKSIKKDTDSKIDIFYALKWVIKKLFIKIRQFYLITVGGY